MPPPFFRNIPQDWHIRYPINMQVIRNDLGCPRRLGNLRKSGGPIPAVLRQPAPEK
jgi:hypothetical protein